MPASSPRARRGTRRCGRRPADGAAQRAVEVRDPQAAVTPVREARCLRELRRGARRRRCRRRSGRRDPRRRRAHRRDDGQRRADGHEHGGNGVWHQPAERHRATDHRTGCATIQEVDAPLVRAYLEALPHLPSDGKALERVRFCLAALQSPDVRYLVAAVVGPDAGEIARVTAAVLRAAGAPTGILGRSLAATTIDGAPIDDGLLARAGTLTAASGYQLADLGRDLGELTRHEASVILGLTAFAEASQRVALLVEDRKSTRLN